MGATRWLDDDEQEAWRTFLFASQRLNDSLDRQMYGAGMPHSYYLILAMLSEAPERSMTMSELAELTRSSASRMSHAVTKLEARDWVRRRRCPGNARVTIATLTDAGYAALAEAAPSHVEHVRRIMFDSLTPEQVRQLRDIFRAVLANFEGGEHSCFPSRREE